MRKSREFDNILAECVERLLVHGETVEQCLQNYPGYADELKPLLETALAAKEASAIQPRPEFRDRARYQFHLALQEMEPKKSRSFLSWQPRWATAVAVVLILLVIGSGTVVAARGSMPGEPLYSVKLATEQLQLWLTPSSLGKAELYAELADKRVIEIVSMAEENKPEQIELTTQRLDTYLAKIADLASTQQVAGEAVMAPSFEKAPAEEEALEDEVVPSTEETVVPPSTEEAAVAPPTEEIEVLPPDVQVEEPPLLSERAVAGEAADNSLDRWASLRMTVMRYAINHPASLRALLETVSPSTRDALLEAISISEAGYEKALESLD